MIVSTIARPGDMLRWALSACMVLMAHAGFAAAITLWQPPMDSAEPSGAFVIELAPLPVARADVPTDIAPGPEQTQSEAAVEKRVETVEQPKLEIPPAAEPEVAVSAAPKAEQQPEEQAAQTPVPTTSVSQVPSERVAPVAAAPTIGEPRATPSVSLPSWTSKLVATLERNKRYPTRARDRREQGIAHLSFSIDRTGKMTSSWIARSSGSATLDAEALDLLHRAQPFPAPPPDLPGEQIVLSVPIRFQLR